MTARDYSNFIEYFKTFDTFTTADITAFFRKNEPELKQSTINWRVYVLVNDQLIARVSKGIFRVKDEKGYEPVLDKGLMLVARKVKRQFPFIDICVWDTSVINSFAQHITNQTFFVVEVEKDALEPVFHYLQDSHTNIFYKPTQDTIDNYLFRKTSKPYVLKNLVTESPTIEKDGVRTASLEKILVDIYCDKQLFYHYQGNELKTLYRNCFEAFNINRTLLARYASRRGKASEIKDYINQIICNNH